MSIITDFDIFAMPIYLWQFFSEIKKLGSALVRHTGEGEMTTTRHLFQQLSIALVKGDAALMNNRNPSDGGQGDEGLGW